MASSNENADTNMSASTSTRINGSVSLDKLPTEILLRVAEQCLTLESLVAWTQVCRKLRVVGQDVLFHERYWANILAFDADHTGRGVEKADSGQRYRLWYKVSVPVLRFMRVNEDKLRTETRIYSSKEGHIWRHQLVRCHGLALAKARMFARVRSSHEPCFETGICQCTGECDPIMEFPDVVGNKERGCCAQSFRAY